MKRSILILNLLLFGALSSLSQTTHLFVDDDFYEYSRDHKKIALIPFKTKIVLNENQLKKIENKQLENIEKEESFNYQEALYSWFKKRRDEGNMWVEIQDIQVTNKLLKDNNITYSDIDKYTPVEIADLLDVDAVIKGTLKTTNPMSEAASIALGLLSGFYGSTNTATLNLFIYDGDDEKLLVNYIKGYGGFIGSTTESVVNKVMKKASRRIPYTKPRK